LIDFANIEVALQKLQVSQKLVIRSNFKALKVLLANELENYQFVLCKLRLQLVALSNLVNFNTGKRAHWVDKACKKSLLNGIEV